MRKPSRIARHSLPRFVPQVCLLEDRAVPAAGFRPVPDDAVAVTPDDGGIPRVRLIDPATGEDVGELQAYEDSFRGGVRVALGDVTGDGVRDVVIAPGTGGGPRVRVVDGKTGDTAADFFVYEPSFTGGITVAVGDVNGDGRDDLVTGTGDGGAPRVRVLDGAALGGKVLRDFFAYEDSFRGGVLVAAGDVDGDGRDDVLTGTGVGGGPRVVGFSGRTGAVVTNFFAYEDSFRGGVLVSAADVDGDGRDDIVCGTGPGGGPVVRVVGGGGRELGRFFADDVSFRGGVRVDAADANGDGRDDLITETRHGNDVELRVFRGEDRAFLRTITRRVDDNPSPRDQVERPAGTVAVPTPGAAVKIEGTVTAADAAAGTVGIRLGNGQVTTVTLAAGAEVERNDVHTTLAAFRVGDRGEALVGPDGKAWKVEAEGAGATPPATPGNDDGTPDQGPGDGGSGSSGNNSGGGNSGGGGSNGGQQEQRVEGAVTAVNAAGGTVTIGATVVRVGPGTKVERNDRETTLAAFRVGDRGQARVGADGVATRIEAFGS